MLSNTAKQTLATLLISNVELAEQLAEARELIEKLTFKVPVEKPDTKQVE